MSDEQTRNAEAQRPEPPDASGQSERSDPADVSDAELARAEREQLAKLEAELARANDQHLRARAELANYQKRVERDRALAGQAIKRDFVKTLLPAFDALNLALKHAGAEAGPLLEGVKAARDAFEKALASQGAERIRNSGTWDHDLHHPQAAVERADLPEGTILEEIRPGYKVGSLVARHSEVVVSKRPGPEKAAPTGKAEGPGPDA